MNVVCCCISKVDKSQSSLSILCDDNKVLVQDSVFISLLICYQHRYQTGQSKAMSFYTSGDSVNAIVADFGSYASKVGYAGEDYPRSYFRSVSSYTACLVQIDFPRGQLYSCCGFSSFKNHSNGAGLIFRILQISFTWGYCRSFNHPDQTIKLNCVFKSKECGRTSRRII